MTEKQTLFLKRLEDFLAPGYQPPYLQMNGREVGGHEIDHPRRMCVIAEKIVGPDVDLFLLKTAIWFHNLDRSVYPYTGVNPKYFANGSYVPWIIWYYLGKELPWVLPNPEVDSVIMRIADAIECHSRPNEPDDSTLTIYLKDCDRLDRMGAIGLFDIIHYSIDRNFPLYTAADFIHQLQSTAEDQLKSVVNNVRRILEWERWLRVPKAKELAAPGCTFLRSFLTKLEWELQDLGILPA
ncbi:MAG: hypothetical protein HYS57_02905 [Parcubacteria group bacterium]|nr:hypothetical protein [Parcubacteria group bacterium]